MFVVVKRPLDFARAIRIPNLMRGEGKAEALAKRFHLGSNGGVLASATCKHHRGIVDHAPPCRPLQKHQRVGQKDLAPEAIPSRIALLKAHPRVAQHQRRRLHLAAPATKLKVMGRGVVLHLHPGSEDVLARWLFHAHPDTEPPQSCRQRRIWNRDFLCGQLLDNAHPVAFTALVKLAYQLCMWLCLVGALSFGHRHLPAMQNLPNRVAGDLERPRDRTCPQVLAP